MFVKNTPIEGMVFIICTNSAHVQCMLFLLWSFSKSSLSFANFISCDLRFIYKLSINVGFSGHLFGSSLSFLETLVGIERKNYWFCRALIELAIAIVCIIIAIFHSACDGLDRIQFLSRRHLPSHIAVLGKKIWKARPW